MKREEAKEARTVAKKLQVVGKALKQNSKKKREVALSNVEDPCEYF